MHTALGEIEAGILLMHRNMLTLNLTTDAEEHQSIINEIDATEAHAHRQFDIVFQRYLGPRQDAEEAFQAFVAWKAYRNGTIRLWGLGQKVEAQRRIWSKGPGYGPNRTLERLQVLMDFADKKGDQFFQNARRHKDELLLRTGLVLAGVLGLYLAICYALLGTSAPLKELIAVAQAFNAMLDRVQEQSQLKEQAATMAAMMLREEDLGPFCRRLLATLLELTACQAGAIYMLDESGMYLEHYDSIGLGPGARARFSTADLEGEFGAVLATGKVQLVQGLPNDTRFGFLAAGGTFQPRELLTIPVTAAGQMTA